MSSLNETSHNTYVPPVESARSRPLALHRLHAVDRNARRRLQAGKASVKCDSTLPFVYRDAPESNFGRLWRMSQSDNLEHRLEVQESAKLLIRTTKVSLYLLPSGELVRLIAWNDGHYAALVTTYSEGVTSLSTADMEFVIKRLAKYLGLFGRLRHL